MTTNKCFIQIIVSPMSPNLQTNWTNYSAALKVILGKDYDGYEMSLEILNMESLNKRRESMALKFVKNGLNNHNFSKVFPLRKLNHGMSKRRGERYHVNISKTKRCKDSAVPYLQGLLNKDDLEKK